LPRRKNASLQLFVELTLIIQIVVTKSVYTFFVTFSLLALSLLQKEQGENGTYHNEFRYL